MSNLNKIIRHFKEREDGFLKNPPIKASSKMNEPPIFKSHSSRIHELFRAFRVFFEFIRGVRSLHFVGPCVTVFGSTRFTQNTHPYYQLGLDVGHEIAKQGFTTITNGGPGLMEATNRGAKEQGGKSIGCNDLFPREYPPNAYLDRWILFRYFFVRNLILAKYSHAFIILPGGFGTLDELFEVASLIQTGKRKNFPVILIGKNYWNGLAHYLKDPLNSADVVDASDLNGVLMTNSPAEAINWIHQSSIKKFGENYLKPLKPRWFFGERIFL